MLTFDFYPTGLSYPSWEETHRRFGGIIRSADFEPPYYLAPASSPIARRIVRDWRFDEGCLKNAEEREEEQEYVRRRGMESL